MVRLKAAPFF